MLHGEGEEETGQPQFGRASKTDQEVIEAQLRQFELRPVRRDEQNGPYLDDRPELFLIWTEGVDSAQALGLYTKWLVLVSLLLQWRPEDHGFLKATIGSRRGQRLTKLFRPESPHRLLSPNRYDPTAPDRSESERALDKVLLALFEVFNRELKARNWKEIGIEAFVREQVSLQPDSQVVGHQPMRRLRHWLLHRSFLPNPGLRRVARDHEDPAYRRALSLLARLRDGGVSDAAHKVILQVLDAPAGLGRPGIAESLYAACQQDDGAESFLPVIISLDANATRSRVIEALYKALLPGQPAPSLVARELDLANDLEPLRRVLTVGRVLLIFDHCDSHAGPFSNLHDFLCDTMWSEMLRCLVQPVQGELLRVGQPPGMQGRIVLVAVAPLEGIEPWLSPAVADCESPLTGFASPPMSPATLRALRALVRADGNFALLPADVPSNCTSLAEQVSEEELRMLAPFEPVMLRLIVASVNGMQRPTLQRCLKTWVQLYGWTPGLRSNTTHETQAKRRDRIEHVLAAIDEPASFERLIDELLNLHSELLEEVPGEQTPWLSDEARETGLDQRPAIPGVPRDEGPDRLTIQVRSRAAASAAVMAWRGPRKFVASAPGGMAPDIAGWEQIAFVLCGESLRQATEQMRGLSHRTPEGVHWYRRFMQVVYHGLCCTQLDVTTELQAAAISSSLSFGGLPGEPARRYRYLYSFIYRQCIEGGDWRLGRSYGRSDLRLEVLTLFVRPSLAHRVVTGGEPIGVLPDLYQPEKPPIPVSDPELRSDLLEALGRAGLDLGSPRGREATEWVLSVLPGWRLGLPIAVAQKAESPRERYDINERLPRRGDAYQRVADSALKLRLDWLQSSGMDVHLSEVRTLAREQLHRLGIAPRALDTLGAGIKRALELVAKNTDGVTDELLGALGEALKALLPRERTVAETMLVADMLFRLAEARATEADNQDFKARSEERKQAQKSKQDTALLFAEACAIYWLADRVRAAAGSCPDAGVRWPMAGARTTRYYVRVALKACRLVLEGTEGPPRKKATDLAFTLLDLAQDRLGLFTRHHFRFERERVSAMLLESARIRTWVRIEVEQAYYAHRLRFIDVSSHMPSLTEQQSTLEKKLQDLERDVRRYKEQEKRFGTAQITPARTAKQRDFDARSSELTEVVRAIDKHNAELVDSRERYDACIRDQARVLAYAIDLIDRAEKALMSLGFQRNHVRRLYLERAKNAGTLARLFSLPLRSLKETDASPAWRQECEGIITGQRPLWQAHSVTEHLAAARTSLAAMKSASANDGFWEQICERQAFSLADAAATLHP